jgi:hypothetical protein
MTMMRRWTRRVLVSTLLVPAAVVVGAAPAHADPRCTGRVEVLGTSEPGTRVVASFARGGASNVYPGRGVSGTELSPVVRFGIVADQAAFVEYFDLRDNRRLGSDVVGVGSFAVNPCHKAVFWVEQLAG